MNLTLIDLDKKNKKVFAENFIEESGKHQITKCRFTSSDGRQVFELEGKKEIIITFLKSILCEVEKSDPK